MARAHHHHHPELLEVDGAVAVAIDAADHPAALGEGAVLAEAAHDGVELLGGDGAVAVDVEDGEGVLEVLQDLVGVDALCVELDELREADAAIAVAVNLADHVVQLQLRRRLPQAPHDRPQLRRRDLAVAVHVELVEHLLQLIRHTRA